VKSYHEWIVDNEYDWPPRCGSCNRTINDDGKKIARLPCYCMFHQDCLLSQLSQSTRFGQDPASLLCFSCNKPFLDAKYSKNALYPMALSLAQTATASSALVTQPVQSGEKEKSKEKEKEKERRNEDEREAREKLKERERERERERDRLKPETEILSHGTAPSHTANLRVSMPYKADISVIVENTMDQKEKEKQLRRRNRGTTSKLRSSCRMDRLLFCVMLGAIVFSLLTYFTLTALGYFNSGSPPSL